MFCGARCMPNFVSKFEFWTETCRTAQTLSTPSVVWHSQSSELYLYLHLLRTGT